MKSAAMKFGPICAIAAALAGCNGSPPVEPQSAASQQEPAKGRLEVALAPEAQKRAGIELHKVGEESVNETIAATGQLTVNEDQTWSVGTMQDGRIVAVSGKVGDVVKQGQVLARMHSHEVHDSRASYRQAALELARQESAEAYARRMRDRAKRLLDLKAMSQQEYESAEAELKNAQASVLNARAEVEKQRIHLVEFLEVPLVQTAAHSEDFIPIKATESGILIERKASPGSVVSAGQEIFRITTPASIWMIANVNEADLSHLRAGQPVRVLVRAYPGRSFAGRILRVGEELDPATRTLKVHVLLPNPGGMLKPEMYASAAIERAAARSGLFVPQGAAQDLNGNRVVFVRTASGAFEPRPIQTGRTIDGRMEVTSGLKPGEVVVVKGAFVLKSQMLQSGGGE